MAEQEPTSPDTGSDAARQWLDTRVTAAGPYDSFGPTDTEQAANPIHLLQDRLHGRWMPAIATGVVLGCLFATLGWLFGPVEYTSRGILRVETDLPVVLEGIPETGRLSDAAAYLNAQAELIRSARVLDEALKAKELEPWIQNPSVDLRLEALKHLDVTALRTSLISVEFTSGDAKLSQAAVNAIIKAYMGIQQPEAVVDLETTRAYNEQLRESVRNEIASLSKERETLLLTSLYGTLEVDDLIQRRVLLGQQIDEQLAAIEAAPDDEEPIVAMPTLAELDQIDASLRELRANVRNATLGLQLAEQKFGPQHLEYANASRALAALQSQLASAEMAAKEKWTEGRRNAPAGRTKDEVKAALVKERRQLRDEIDRMNREVASANRIDTQLAFLQKYEQEYTDRLTGLKTEEQSIKRGRVQPVVFGEAPLLPTKDRRKQLAPVGFLGGIALGIGIFFLLGTIDRRAYGAAQLDRSPSALPLIGLIPDMKVLEEDPGGSEIAAQCVHRLRNRIEMLRPAGSGFVLALSSPFQGDGKTSLAIALACSYAASGHRTILVDFDFVGQALSHHYGRLRKVGVREALNTSDLNGEVVALDVANLSLLSNGADPSIGAESLRVDQIHRLLGRLRRAYEVIIVDTGPLVASVESLPVAGAADAVILTLRRGRPRGRLEECAEDLRKFGANCLGVVLNCATRSECYRYSSKSRVSAELEDEQSDTRRQRGGDRRALLAALGHEPVKKDSGPHPDKPSG